MPNRIGLGPVYEFERLTQSRRWQVYAMRSGFGLALLITMGVIWFSGGHVTGSNSFKEYAKIGEAFFLGMTGMQIALVLLAAPAATAGAVCLDKQRGSLTHLLVTDLSDAEIVLGKLAARLGPVLGLLGGALPIVALASLFGGHRPRAPSGAFLISIGVAVLGCSIALTLSVWASKTSEVLLGTYAVLGIWLLAVPMASALGYSGRRRWSGPEWIEACDPFRLALRPYIVPGSENVSGGAIFLVVSLALSAAMLGLATRKLRPVAANPRPPKVKKVRVTRIAKRPSWMPAVPIPAPSLDGNPVLWREWQRRTSSRWMRSIVILYALVSLVYSLLVIVPTAWTGNAPAVFAAWTNAIVGSIGLLMLSVTASTSLAEERVRGSLDVLLCTPMSTRSIVWGKWLGTFRGAIPLAILPCLVALASGFSGGHFLAWILIPFYVIATAAAITSIGLAMATWQSRLGRAVAITVSIYLAVTVGWLFFVLSFFNGPIHSINFLSPFFALAEGTFILGQSGYPSGHYLPGMTLSIVAFSVVSSILLEATIRTFDRRLGRTPEGGTKRVRSWRPKRAKALSMAGLE